MKVAIISDTHCGARNSSSIFANYQRDFYSKIFFPYLRENGIKKILHLGDYYDHRKFVNFYCLNNDRRFFLDKVRQYGMEVEIIPGNHDVYYKNTNELNSLTELMVGYEDVVNIHLDPVEIEYDSVKICLVPWINAENYIPTLKFVQESDAKICAGHFEFSGFEMYRGSLSHHGIDQNPYKKFDMVLSGHYHTKSSRGNIHYLGAQLEFNWSDVDDPKYFHIFDTETMSIEPIRNPLTLFKKVVYDDREFDYNHFDYSIFRNQYVKVIVVNKIDPAQFDTFIDNIQLQSIHDLKIIESLDDWTGEMVEDAKFEETTELIEQYVDGVETLLDRETLKSQLKSLYHEAQRMDLM